MRGWIWPTGHGFQTIELDSRVQGGSWAVECTNQIASVHVAGEWRSQGSKKGREGMVINNKLHSPSFCNGWSMTACVLVSIFKSMAMGAEDWCIGAVGFVESET